jgi:hypothetical protein
MHGICVLVILQNHNRKSCFICIRILIVIFLYLKYVLVWLKLCINNCNKNKKKTFIVCFMFLYTWYLCYIYMKKTTTLSNNTNAMWGHQFDLNVVSNLWTLIGYWCYGNIIVYYSNLKLAHDINWYVFHAHTT